MLSTFSVAAVCRWQQKRTHFTLSSDYIQVYSNTFQNFPRWMNVSLSVFTLHMFQSTSPIFRQNKCETLPIHLLLQTCDHITLSLMSIKMQKKMKCKAFNGVHRASHIVRINWAPSPAWCPTHTACSVCREGRSCF